MLKILRNFLLLWGMVLLQACASLGTPPIDTFNKRVAVAYTSIQTVAESALALQRAGKLSPADVDKIRFGLHESMDEVRAAEALVGTDVGAAQTQLQAAIRIFTGLQVFVSMKQGTAK
jgi:hypothetical protein